MPKINPDDYIGKKFNRLTVIKVLPPSGVSGVARRCICKCECGNKVETTIRIVRDNQIKSCGCFTEEKRLKPGDVFGKLTIVKQKGKDKWGKYLYVCKCECGNVISVCASPLKSGNTKGCVKCRHTYFIHNGASVHKEREFNSWKSMIKRCYNKDSHNYKNYGARGITVCKRWRDSFANFYQDMGDRPKGKTIDRIDCNGHYNLKNCRWASPFTQANNRKDNIKILYKGKLMTIGRACRLEYGKKYNRKMHSRIDKRVRLGWSHSKLFK